MCWGGRSNPPGSQSRGVVQTNGTGSTLQPATSFTFRLLPSGGPIKGVAAGGGNCGREMTSHPAATCSLYRLIRIRHARLPANTATRHYSATFPNRQSFPTGRKSGGTVIERGICVDTVTDRRWEDHGSWPRPLPGAIDPDVLTWDVRTRWCRKNHDSAAASKPSVASTMS